MPATFLGAVTIGGALVGLSTGVTSVETAFETFRATVAAQTALIDSAAASIDTQASLLAGIGEIVVSLGDLIEDAKAAIRIPAGGDLVFQIAGITQGQSTLTVSLANPAAYISGLIAGAQQAITSLQAAVPAVQITGQLTASGIALLALQSKLSAIDAALALLDVPAAQVRAQGAAIQAAAAAIQAVVAAIVAIVNALTAAVAAADVALATLSTIQASLGTAGAYAFIYTGPLSGLGAALDAVTPSTGVAAAAQVYVPVVFVQQGDAPAVAAVNAVYLTS